MVSPDAWFFILKNLLGETQLLDETPIKIIAYEGNLPGPVN
jgi:hypothetical protein